jgi:transposase-like protein
LVESAATEGGRIKRSRFNEEQIIAILKEQECGLGTADLCRKNGISSATFYKWKAKYGGLEVSKAWRLDRWKMRTPASRSDVGPDFGPPGWAIFRG